MSLPDNITVPARRPPDDAPAYSLTIIHAFPEGRNTFFPVKPALMRLSRLPPEKQKQGLFFLQKLLK